LGDTPNLIKLSIVKNIYLLTILSIIFSSCIKKECQISGRYNFEIPVTLSPTREIYNIGDTITIISSFSEEVYDRNTDRYYALTDFSFYPRMIIREISDTITNEAALSNFDVLIDTIYNISGFQYNSGGISYLWQYNYQNNYYNLSCNLIAKNPGLFHFSYSSSLSTTGEHQEFEGKCPRTANDATVVLNQGASNNFYLVNESPDPHYNEWMEGNPEARFHKHGGYCFRVVE